MEEEVKTEETKQINVSTKTLFIIFGVVALGLLMVVKICANFGLASAVFYGIMSILIYGLSFAGIICSYLIDKKTSFEFWVNLVAFALAIFVL